MIFVLPSSLRGENSDKLEFDDTLNEIAMFSRSQGSQNELKLVPKRAERSKESREDANREQRGDKVRSRASEERSGAKSRLPGGVAEIPG